MMTSELIAKLERDLAALQRIPARHREAELADIREETCGSMLAAYTLGGHWCCRACWLERLTANFLGRLPALGE